MPNGMKIDDSLESWENVKDAEDWSGLLVGNGASRAVWEKFDYPSLYQKACSNEVAHPLQNADQAVFATLQTENFEATLAGLKTSEKICASLAIPHQPIIDRYQTIRAALIEAVQAVHIGWNKLPAATLTKIRDALLPYGYVYSTNYDLLLYWAIMSEPQAKGFADYFWGASCLFDLANVDVWNKATKVLYLHGGLHIYRLADGTTVKKVVAQSGNLLDSFGVPYKGVDIPLFIAEGHADDKLRSIRRSEYLTFAFTRFTEHRGPLVIFGHSLGAPDRHVVNAMQFWSTSQVPCVAISLMPDTAKNVIARKADLHKTFHKLNLTFFDATTHPLADPTLHVNP